MLTVNHDRLFSDRLPFVTDIYRLQAWCVLRHSHSTWIE